MNEEDHVMGEHSMANETIHDSATKIHIQKLFGIYMEKKLYLLSIGLILKTEMMTIS